MNKHCSYSDLHISILWIQIHVGDFTINSSVLGEHWVMQSGQSLTFQTKHRSLSTFDGICDCFMPDFYLFQNVIHSSE